MAGFDIHRVKTGLLGKQSRFPEFLFQSLQIVIGNDAAVVGCPVLLQLRVTVGDHGGGLVVGIGVAAAVIGLHDQVGGKAVGLQTGFLNGGGKGLVGVQRLPGEQKLGFAGTTLFHNGDRLKPDDGAAADGLVDIPPQGVLGGRAVGGRVSALHGCDAHAVGEGDITDSQRLGQRGGIRGEGKGKPQLSRFGLNLLQRFVMKFLVSHTYSFYLRPQRASTWSTNCSSFRLNSSA